MILPSILGLICAAIAYYFIVYKENKRKKGWEMKFPLYKPQLQTGVWQTKIANIRYHCNKDDIGVVVFAVKAESENSYNADSMTLLRDDGKVLGYISKREAVKFNLWSGKQPCSGIGIILYDAETNKLWGDVIIFVPDTDDSTIEREVRRYLQWAEQTYGTAFIPERYK